MKEFSIFFCCYKCSVPYKIMRSVPKAQGEEVHPPFDEASKARRLTWLQGLPTTFYPKEKDEISWYYHFTIYQHLSEMTADLSCQSVTSILF